MIKMGNKRSYQEVAYMLPEITTEEAAEINGGDGITEAVFWSLGYWVQTYSDFKAYGATSYAGSAGFI
jgi:hypothetical protein